MKKVVTISEVGHFTHKKDGSQYISKKTGKPYARCTITDIEGVKYYGYASQDTHKLNQG